MRIATTVAEARAAVAQWKSEGLRIGLVPTMGFLHEGHESLMQAAAEENDRVAVSVFVNPTQFGPGEDLDRYPQDFERDLAICRKNGVGLVFHPTAGEMYPPPFYSAVRVDVLSAGLCGKSRPTHFEGVCTVVCKLLNIISADRAYFGEKDAQQLAVVRRMVLDLNLPVEVRGCPIVREADGLAKSSRNAYLSPEERQAALVLCRSLREARALADAGERDSSRIMERISGLIASEALARIDYVEIVDAVSLQPVARLEGPVLIALAVFFGKTRLIDNARISLP
ncbi:pantoate--beta-alanine ligase [Desulfovibrio sp. OttesenSCG-928-A18]|nr:pantoate--beta-alanine ligase [Desulfovibrio sp. OttesenSCG-928-A18]